jgi:hypothetical protein
MEHSSGDLIEAAEDVAKAAESLHASLLVIGAAALAGHHYVRLTQDLDLAGNLSVDELHQLEVILRAKGYRTELRVPDPQDPLGGVLDLFGPFGQIQVISFADRFPAVIADGLQDKGPQLREDSNLYIIALPHLVVLKLYAGGYKSKSDIFEVLSRNPDADLEEIDALCRKYRISGFEEIRRELER